VLDPLLRRQLEEVGHADERVPPSAAAWASFLEQVSRTYARGPLAPPIRSLGEGLSALAELQKQLAESARVLEEGSRRLELEREAALHASRAKSEFLGNLSQELRAPMNALLGFASLLGGTSLDPEQRAFLETLRVSVSALLESLDEMLDFSRLEAGTVAMEDLTFDLGVLMDDVRDRLGYRAREKGLDLACSIDAGVPRALRGDPARLRQALLCLAGNAIKLTDSGEVRLLASCDAEAGRRVRLRLAVRDTGRETPAEERDRLLEPFAPGRLGLAIARRLIELMGGRLAFESAAGGGSTAFFELTLERQEVARAEAAAGAPPVADRYDRLVKRLSSIGVLEDVECTSEVLRAFLDDAPRVLDKLRDAIAGSDGDACQRLAHRLKGSSLSLGAEALGALAARLEQESKRFEQTVAEPLLEALRVELDCVRLAAERLLRGE
jgi:signal transduction histidine kinase/HPt (histidine-containing phosphotransfer) domain-containing protein